MVLKPSSIDFVIGYENIVLNRFPTVPSFPAKVRAMIWVCFSLTQFLSHVARPQRVWEARAQLCFQARTKGRRSTLFPALFPTPGAAARSGWGRSAPSPGLQHQGRRRGGRERNAGCQARPAPPAPYRRPPCPRRKPTAPRCPCAGPPATRPPVGRGPTPASGPGPGRAGPGRGGAAPPAPRRALLGPPEEKGRAGRTVASRGNRSGCPRSNNGAAWRSLAPARGERGREQEGSADPAGQGAPDGGERQRRGAPRAPGPAEGGVQRHGAAQRCPGRPDAPQPHARPGPPRPGAARPRTHRRWGLLILRGGREGEAGGGRGGPAPHRAPQAGPDGAPTAPVRRGRRRVRVGRGREGEGGTARRGLGAGSVPARRVPAGRGGQEPDSNHCSRRLRSRARRGLRSKRVRTRVRAAAAAGSCARRLLEGAARAPAPPPLGGLSQREARGGRWPPQSGRAGSGPPPPPSVAAAAAAAGSSALPSTRAVGGRCWRGTPGKSWPGGTSRACFSSFVVPPRAGAQAAASPPPERACR